MSNKDGRISEGEGMMSERVGIGESLLFLQLLNVERVGIAPFFFSC